MERRVKWNNKTPFHQKILIVIADHIGQLTIRNDSVKFEQILWFSKIECSIRPFVNVGIGI